MNVNMIGSSQDLINILSDRKHKANLGAPHILAKIRLWGGERKKGDSTNTIEKTYNTFLVLSVTFYFINITENTMQKDFSKIQTYCYLMVHNE